ncbi:MAG: nucleoside triphosphate pyrophosphohydrolase [Deltaproteobacteria bacterium]|nr:nucleoside triphosphate pyrophosphohydrolase [Deltaproteobacteria bacterium]MBW2152288.1 nucleoside triphosphate pyrophosphohydrolase [Deltaproteobacteria bacterium]
MDKKRVSKAFIDLIDLVKRLRGPDGCPWDREQSDLSIKTYVIEEAYEVLDAIERGVPDDVCQELGDLLFQILFLVDMAEEKGQFCFLEVLEKIRKKMIDRHPHVFGDVKVRSPEEVSQNWVRIKEAEGKENSEPRSAVMGTIPESLPALLRAHRLSERSLSLWLCREDHREKWSGVEEAFQALRDAFEVRGEDLEEKLGMLLFKLSDLARHLGLNAENALRGANSKFLRDIQNPPIR